jgi:hypothetical protein
MRFGTDSIGRPREHHPSPGRRRGRRPTRRRASSPARRHPRSGSAGRPARRASRRRTGRARALRRPSRADRQGRQPGDDRGPRGSRRVRRGAHPFTTVPSTSSSQRRGRLASRAGSSPHSSSSESGSGAGRARDPTRLWRCGGGATPKRNMGRATLLEGTLVRDRPLVVTDIEYLASIKGLTDAPIRLRVPNDGGVGDLEPLAMEWSIENGELVLIA